MKHGTVTNGRTTTYYGNDAQSYLARQAAMFCADQKAATELVTNCTGPNYRAALVDALQKMGYKFTKKLIEELNQRDAASEAKLIAKHLAKKKESFRSFELADTPTGSKCEFCKLKIKKGTTYYDGGRGARAHVACTL
jgi:hypothetical protein